MEHRSIIWGYKVNSFNNRALLESAQRYALKTILRAPPSTPTAALEAELNISPIDLRLLELQRLECIRILRKPSSDFTKVTLTSSTHHTSPCHYLNNILLPLHQQLTNMYQNYYLEPEPKLTTALSQLTPILSLHNLDLNLGNSSNRTPEQKQEGQQIVTNQSKQCSDLELLGFTDGSALSNPGPAGAAAVVLKQGPNSVPLTIGESLPQSDNFEAELRAINLFSHFCLKNLTNYHTALKIFIDSQSAILSISSTAIPPNNHSLVNETRNTLFLIQETFEIPIHLYWIPSHSKIGLNEMADKCAKIFAKTSKRLALNKTNVVTVGNARLANKVATNTLWNKRWKLTPHDCLYIKDMLETWMLVYQFQT